MSFCSVNSETCCDNLCYEYLALLSNASTSSKNMYQMVISNVVRLSDTLVKYIIQFYNASHFFFSYLVKHISINTFYGISQTSICLMYAT